MDLSIVIVNWNSAAFLRECLRSIYAPSLNLQFEVIVIDNASFDTSEMVVRGEFPAVKFIQSPRNLGFAGANNLAFAHSSGRNVLFLNPDTEIVGEALKVMCAFLDTTADAGVVGCRLLNSDMSVQTSCIQAFPSILKETLDCELLQRLFPKSSLWGMSPLFAPAVQPSPVDVISGACLMIRRNVFEQVGRFSTDYFMYAEDMDLCYKVQHAGWRNYFVGEATVVHHGGCCSRLRPNSFAAVTMRESKLIFMRKRDGGASAFGFRCSTALIASLRIFILALALPFARQKAAGSLGKWLSIFCWSLGFKSRVNASRPLSTSPANVATQNRATTPKVEGI